MLGSADGIGEWDVAFPRNVVKVAASSGVYCEGVVATTVGTSDSKQGISDNSVDAGIRRVGTRIGCLGSHNRGEPSNTKSDALEAQHGRHVGGL